MKKSNAIQLAIIITAIVVGFNAIQAFMQFTWNFFLSISEERSGNRDYYFVFTSFIYFALEMAAAILLVRTSGKLAGYISDKAGNSGNISLVVKPESLLQILLITMAIYFLVANAPAFLVKLFDTFKGKAGNTYSYLNDDNRPSDWPRLILSLVMPFILLMASGPIAAFFSKQVSSEPISLGQQIEEIEVADYTDTERS